ncbi:ASCH/PUA domain-containing protein [Enterococcus mundtii]
MKPAITIEIDHQLKILPQYFQAVSIGDKTFEIRKNDRDFKVGDNIALSEYEDGQYTGRSILVVITYITDYEQKDDYIVFGIKTSFVLNAYIPKSEYIH